ncbi:MAG: single-stranded DNA-binding protein [Elusimicrobia bacterium]|jgi:single-strand DNA-binding protein|nr:single-stranded DNA-binding protein [Elusimicrobiota bacterium]
MSTLLRLVQLNNVQLVGRLTRDPELRFTTSGAPVCRFDLAVNRRYKDKAGEWKDDTSFIPVVVWREAGQRCGEKLKKGSPVYVEGRLKSRNWETKDGQKRSGHEVDASRVQFLEKADAGVGSPATDEEAPSAESDVSGSAPTTEDVPF